VCFPLYNNNVCSSFDLNLMFCSEIYSWFFKSKFLSIWKFLYQFLHVYITYNIINHRNDFNNLSSIFLKMKCWMKFRICSLIMTIINILKLCYLSHYILWRHITYYIVIINVNTLKRIEKYLNLIQLMQNLKSEIFY